MPSNLFISFPSFATLILRRLHEAQASLGFDRFWLVAVATTRTHSAIVVWRCKKQYVLISINFPGCRYITSTAFRPASTRFTLALFELN